MSLSPILEVYGPDESVKVAFLEVLAETNRRAVVERSWETDTDALPFADAVLVTRRNDGRTSWFERGVDADLCVEYRKGGSLTVLAAAETTDAAEKALDALATRIPSRQKVDDGTIVARFWYLGSHGPVSVSRKIAAPTFDTIADNYTAPVAAALSRLVGPDFRPGRGGQLLLWHGPPGTGKTWALRSVARAWESWCRIDYVVDPEAFFGKASYLMPVLLDDDNSFRSDDEDDRAGWRLLIFEDTGELLSADARERAGQGLSRLLNTVDGFIGQGLRTLILITTNEELGRLHPAVSRPGRAASTIAFSALDPSEVALWAQREEIARPPGSATLAELFAIRDGRDVARQPQPVGFRA